MNIKEQLANELISIYPGTKKEDILYTYCPYRICPVGAHIDHQKGKVTGFALNCGITIAFIPSNNHFFETKSLNFEGIKGDNLLDIPDKQNDWADYLRGTAKLLHDKFAISKGVYAVIDGSLPIGGISSSAAVIIAFIKALCIVNELQLTKEEVVLLAQEVENKYVGVSSGTLDQSCELFSKKDHLLSLDTSTGKYTLIPKNKNMKPYKIAIIFSGVKRTLVGSAYNTRVDELKSAAYCLKAFSNTEYGMYKDTVLRDVSREIFEKYKTKLPSNWYKRALHYYSEMERVDKAIEAWTTGNLEEFGKISFASGESSINNYEAGSEELKTIHQIINNTKGIYGGRFSGAGFKGCCLAIINPDYEESIIKEITDEYLQKFPQYKDSFGIYICETADGCDF